MAILLDGTLGITTPGLTNTGTETIVNLTTTGNTILGDASTDTLNVGNGGLVKDASGNVGIGTATPTQKLDVNGNIRTTGEIATSAADFVYSWAGGTTGQRRSGFYLDGSNQVLRFYTAQAEVGRFDSSGNLLLNTTINYNGGKIARIDDTNDRVKSVIVNNNNSGSSSRCGYIVNAFGNSWAMEMGSTAANSNALNWTVDIFGSPVVRMALTTAGAATNSTGTWGTISDARLKENIIDASPKLGKLMQLRVVNYNLKSDPDIKMLGFVAQEIEQVFPNMVEASGDLTEDGDRYKSVKTTVLIPMLIKALQEQQAIITQLQADVAALKGTA